jgi:hypothetical protein
MIVGSIYVPGVGTVQIRAKRTLSVHNQDGTGALHVFLGPVLPSGPGPEGEPLPIEDVA